MAGKPNSAWTHGPVLKPDGVNFRLWAPAQEHVELVLEGQAGPVAMNRDQNGFHEVHATGLRPGALYRFRLSDGRLVPDPASRFQPFGVEGPSELVNTDLIAGDAWTGRRWDDIVLYELHVGAFSREGTFAGVASHLDHLSELGVTALQLMPVNAFAGRRNWGYDGVLPYATATPYGRPEDLANLVREAHDREIAVLLDVVYNHFGPEGNFLPVYAPDFFTARHKTPWGAAINFDGPNSQAVRAFFVENALYWIQTFRLDGLRLDAVHSIRDDGKPDILEEIAERIRQSVDWPVHLTIENDHNEPHRLPRRDGAPVHYTAQWNDDAHHVLHVAATSEKRGYYSDYGGARMLGRALAQGFAFQGEISQHRNARRGAPSGELPPGAFVTFLQNHDQIGNRAFGERMDQLTSPAAMKALASVYLLLPQTPMVFMGEEWAAAQPFPFFCDFRGELAEAVRKGRRAEFQDFPEFSDPARRAEMPDPLAEETFLSAILDWDQRDADRLALYQDLLGHRRRFIRPLLPWIERGGHSLVLGEQAVRVLWEAGPTPLVLDANLSDRTEAFPAAESQLIWTMGQTGAEFGPWSVRWSMGAQ